MKSEPTKRVLLNPPRERLVEGRERLQPDTIQPSNVRFVIKHPSKDLYLRSLVYIAMEEDEKWRPLEWTSCFLSREGAEKFAKRMLGHNNFTIVPKAEK